MWGGGCEGLHKLYESAFATVSAPPLASARDATGDAGADDADAMAIQGQSLSINVRGGQLEQAERAEGIDIGLRVLIGQRQASVSASDINASTISEMAERAVAMANEAPIDPHIGLADCDALAQSWDIAALELCDPTPEPSPDALQNDADFYHDLRRAKMQMLGRSIPPEQARESAAQAEDDFLRAMRETKDEFQKAKAEGVKQKDSQLKIVRWISIRFSHVVNYKCGPK